MPRWAAFFGKDRTAFGWEYACVETVEDRVTVYVYDAAGERSTPFGYDLYRARLTLERDGWVLLHRATPRFYYARKR